MPVGSSFGGATKEAWALARSRVKPIKTIRVWVGDVMLSVELRDSDLVRRTLVQLPEDPEHHIHVAHGPDDSRWGRRREDPFVGLDIVIPDFDLRGRSEGHIPRMVRKEVLDRDRVCQDCGGKGTLVHHLNYQHPIAARDLVLLCGTCHNARHFALRDFVETLAIRTFRRGDDEVHEELPEDLKLKVPWPPFVSRAGTVQDP